MGAPAATDNHTSIVRSEQSLRRSFSAIHRSPVNSNASTSRHVRHISDISVSQVESIQDIRLKRDLRGKAIRSSLRRNRRCTLDTVTTHALPSVDELPALPFSNGNNGDDVEPLQRKSLRERSPAKKFQRRHSPLDADMAQEMENKLAMEKQSEMHLMRMTSTDSYIEGADEEQHKGFRRDYSIGETIRSSSHMIIEPTSEQAIQAVNSLNKHDFAFVKRSDGSYSYAILAYRSMEPIKGTKHANSNNTEECMVFVMSDAGSTKMVRKHHWSKFVRLPTTQGLKLKSHTGTATALNTHSSTNALSDSIICHPSALRDQHVKENSALLCQVPSEVVCQELGGEIADDDCCMPSMVSFVSEMDDDCSLISSVSDRANGIAR
eukprot:CAMPEP_0196159516 /NCGR_PEP_ID=MMETSP0910-20130528/46362_1 /TAXON_ID=49265 /ORGANISM="Thalassiosira rotula, Strain GSO102" /LENGTH=378 /DNA_ID=CAMNT_0041424437 /DNA_START=64 /DNA_END=1203 /DNA_ORIENTATION=-